MFGLKRKIKKLPQDVVNLVIPEELNHDIVIDINNEENQKFLNILDKEFEKFQSFFKKYYSIKIKLIEIKKSQDKEDIKKNIDLKTVEKEFVELEKEATKLATEFPVFDDLFTQLIIKNFTPK